MDSATASSPERRPSLRWRIALTVAATALLVILVQSIALLLGLDEQEEEFIDDVLNRQIVHSIEAAARHPEAVQPNSPTMSLYRAATASGTQAGIGPSPPALIAGLAIGNHEIHDNGDEYHVAVRDRDGVRYFLAYDVAEHEQRIDALVKMTIAGAFAIGLVTLGTIYFVAGRLTRRLETLAARVANAEVAPAVVGTLAQADMEREVHTVAVALDTAIARQRAALAREREFTGNLSHELRTPLTAIRTDAELLAEMPELPDKARQRAQAIMADADRIADLAASLLLLAREARPRAEEAVNLCAALAAAWRSAGGDAADLALEVDPGLVLTADPAMLDIVLRNLFANVRVHGGGRVRCEFAAGALHVRDFGPGVPAADLPRLFSRFYHRPGSSGHGLGLALVSHVCAACAWQVTAANAPPAGESGGESGGCVFTLVFPDSRISHSPLTPT